MTDKIVKERQQSILDKTILFAVRKAIIFIICIIVYHIVARILGYQIFLLEDPGKEYYIHHIHVKKGYKVYPINYEEDYDIDFWVQDLKYKGYLEKKY